MKGMINKSFLRYHSVLAVLRPSRLRRYFVVLNLLSVMIAGSQAVVSRIVPSTTVRND